MSLFGHIHTICGSLDMFINLLLMLSHLYNLRILCYVDMFIILTTIDNLYTQLLNNLALHFPTDLILMTYALKVRPILMQCQLS